MTAHIHAALMAEYAKDAQQTDTPWEGWEVKLYSPNFSPLVCNPSWDEEAQYRRKCIPKTKMVISGL